MIILIAPENNIPDEIKILHQLFKNGLQYYHLRKPSKSKEELKSYLKKIDEKYYKNIIVHQFHQLAEEFNLKGIHLQEQFRKSLGVEKQDYINNFKYSTNNLVNKTVSSSFHNTQDIEKCNANFDYYLLSPVFNSISKKGYKGKNFLVNHIDKKIIGMGGVTANNLIKIKEKGFKGVAVLGGVWEAKSPIKAFQKIKEKAIF